MSKRVLAAAAVLLAAAAPPVPAPRVTDDQARPVEVPYDTKADAHQAVAAAFAAAQATGRDVLLDFGGNWCSDCRVLSGVLDAPAVKPWMDGNFVTVMVDIGRLTKNLDIASRYGVRVTAAPTVLVVAPDGRLLNARDVLGLADASDMSAQAVVDKLARWRKS